MVGVAQLVELRIVIPAVVGSSPIVHPIESFSEKASARKLQQAARKLQQESLSRGLRAPELRAPLSTIVHPMFYWPFSDYRVLGLPLTDMVRTI